MLSLAEVWGILLTRCSGLQITAILRPLQKKTVVLLITHNPFAGELFEFHPKRDLMEIKRVEWVHPNEADQKVRNPLRNEGYFRIFPRADMNIPVNIYVSQEDKVLPDSLFTSIQSPYVGAGSSLRQTASNN